MDTQVCTRCKTEKSSTEFSVDRSRRTGRRYHCRQCCKETKRQWAEPRKEHLKVYQQSWYSQNRKAVAAKARKRLYGITDDSFNSLLTQQNNCCAVCLETFTETPEVDHDHISNKVRGLLCWNCNTGIGKLGDSYERVQRAAEYLHRAR